MRRRVDGFIFLAAMLYQAAAAAQPPSAAASVRAAETDAIAQEIGDRDLTYVRTRAVFRYDFKSQDGGTTANRVRTKLQYAFGPHHRFGVAVMVPVLGKNTPATGDVGLGDVEIQTGANFYHADRFTMGATIQLTPRTAASPLLGGASTTLKPAWGFTWRPSARSVLNAAFNYKQSIQTVRGNPVKQFEPDITWNSRLLNATWFIEWDSYYDIAPGKLAQTVKTGLGRVLGRDRRVSVSVYYSAGANAYGRATQYRSQAGVDVTCFAASR